MLPANLRAPAPANISHDEARAKTHENFVSNMEQTGLVATDGSGGKVGDKRVRRRAVGAGAASVLFNEFRRPINEALLVAKVPGKQTVPRAEAWAVCCTLEVWP